MDRRLTIALAIAFGIVTFAAAKPSHSQLAPSASANTAIPIPVCNPDENNCGLGGGH